MFVIIMDISIVIQIFMDIEFMFLMFKNILIVISYYTDDDFAI